MYVNTTKRVYAFVKVSYACKDIKREIKQKTLSESMPVPLSFVEVQHFQ